MVEWWWCLVLVPGHYVYIRNPYRIDSFKINFLWVKGSKVTKLMGFFFAMIVAEIIRSVVPSVKNNRAHQPSNWRPTPNSGYTNNISTTTYSAHRRSLDKITISASEIGYLLPNHKNENRIFRVLSTKTTRISTGVSPLLVFLFVCCSCPCILLDTLINHFVAISMVPFNLFHLGRMCCVLCALNSVQSCSISSSATMNPFRRVLTRNALISRSLSHTHTQYNDIALPKYEDTLK